MYDFQIELDNIREHLNIIEAKLKEERAKNTFRTQTNTDDYRNAGRNGNFDG